MIGWLTGLLAGLALAPLGIFCVMELLVLRPDLTDPAVVQSDLVPVHDQPKR